MSNNPSYDQMDLDVIGNCIPFESLNSQSNHEEHTIGLEL